MEVAERAFAKSFNAEPTNWIKVDPRHFLSMYLGVLFIEWLSAKPHGTFTAEKTVGTAWSPALSKVCQLCHYYSPSRTVTVQHAKHGNPAIVSDRLSLITGSAAS